MEWEGKRGGGGGGPNNVALLMKKSNTKISILPFSFTGFYPVRLPAFF